MVLWEPNILSSVENSIRWDYPKRLERVRTFVSITLKGQVASISSKSATTFFSDYWRSSSSKPTPVPSRLTSMWTYCILRNLSRVGRKTSHGEASHHVYKKQNHRLTLRFFRLFSHTRVEVDPNISRRCYHGNDINNFSKTSCVYSKHTLLSTHQAWFVYITEPEVGHSRSKDGDFQQKLSQQCKFSPEIPWFGFPYVEVHGLVLKGRWPRFQARAPPLSFFYLRFPYAYVHGIKTSLYLW